MKRALKVAEVAEMTGRSRSIVYQALTSKALVGAQEDAHATWFVSPEAVERWVSEGCPKRKRRVA